MDSKLYSLFTFSVIYVSRAREMARAGQKDEARAWLKFFRNAGVYDLCCNYFGGFPLDLSKLKSDLDKLEDECHPQSRFAGGFDPMEVAELRAKIDTIAFGISLLVDQKKNPQ